jgi:hypothetical protein
MKLQLPLLAIGAAAIQTCAAAPAGCCANKDALFTPAHYKELVDNYFNIWGKGDVSLIPKTFEEQLNVNIDSVPQNKRSFLPVVNNRTDLAAFVQLFQNMGWKSKEFTVQRWIGTKEGDLVIRWQFTGVIGPNFTIPT